MQSIRPKWRGTMGIDQKGGKIDKRWVEGSRMIMLPGAVCSSASVYSGRSGGGVRGEIPGKEESELKKDSIFLLSAP